MIITKKVEKTIEIDELVGKICNKCGNIFEINYTDTTQNFEVKFSYGSEYENQNPWKWQMCETCLTKLVKSFAIVPENFMSDASIISEYDNNHELHQQLFSEWKETGEWNWEEENPYEEYINPNISYEFDFDEQDDFVEDFYKNQKIDDSNLLPQTTLKIVK